MMHFNRYLCLLLCLVLIFGLRLLFAFRSIEQYAEKSQLRIRGWITSEPYQYASKQMIEVGSFLIQTTPFPQYTYGDFLDISGTLRKEVTDIKQTKLVLMYPTIRIVDIEAERSAYPIVWLRRLLYRLRGRIQENFLSYLPEPQASLLTGIVLGVKGTVPQDFLSALRRTGTIHVVVASGYNITVVAGLISAIFLRFLSRRLAIPFILLAIFLYAMMAGGDPPIIRASIMGSLAFAAQFFGRSYLPLFALLFASLLMLVLSPFTVFDVGFQLSVAATAGILLLSPVLMAWLRRVRLFSFLGEELAVTVGAQLAVLPILLVQFQQTSWLSPLVNVLVVLLIPLVMSLGGIVGLLSFLWRDLGQAAALFSWVPLTIFVEVVSWFDRLPWGVIQVSELSWWWAMGYYLVLGWWVWWVGWRTKKIRLKGG